MSTLATWYHQQYSAWNRTRRLHAPEFLARTDTNTSRAAAAMANNGQDQQQVAVNMDERNGSGSEEKDKKKPETLFGPNIGIVSGGPAWTEWNDKKVTADELTPEIVKAWIARSSEPSQPTTTLQALVNLKRPSLRLTPFSVSPSDDPDHTESQHHHGLEFEYDCDAPKCGIYVHVLLGPDHHLADKSNRGTNKILVFETVTEGGFGKFLKLDEGATLELGTFEHRAGQHAPEPTGETSTSVDKAQAHEGNGPADGAANRQERKKRFSTFHFRKRHHARAVAGPALAVVDAEAPAPTEDADKAEETRKDASSADEEGVKVMITLVALDEDGKEVVPANEQVTYLHVVRLGAPPARNEDGPAEEDKRPWVVKVVKREASIGPHTFHLHEIYGLSSYSTTPSQPVAPTASSPTSPTATHTYPPLPSTTHEDEPSSECLLCLSSPREVVLLPCRHLVACKECAINMVEFGAGGTITHSEGTDATGGTTVGAEGGASGVNPSPNGAPVGSAADAPVPHAPRRKRKAKGWFCPVCRQPYTSLLRITNTPPAQTKNADKRASTSTDGADATVLPILPETDVNALPPVAAPAMAQTAPSRSPLAAFAKPGFLRNLTGRGPVANGGGSNPTTMPPDLERGPAVPSANAL